jgi:hypothetical protein
MAVASRSNVMPQVSAPNPFSLPGGLGRNHAEARLLSQAGYHAVLDRRRANKSNPTMNLINNRQKSKGGGGKRPGAGRPKGSRNKLTALLKDAILEAAEQAGGEGGVVAYLKKQAADSPGPFLALLGKVLPMTVAGAPGEPPIQIQKIERTVIYPPNWDASDTDGAGPPAAARAKNP